MKTEFVIGQHVTYKPIGVAHDVIVKGIEHDSKTLDIVYYIENVPGADHVIREKTTGTTILESELFEVY